MNTQHNACLKKYRTWLVVGVCLIVGVFFAMKYYAVKLSDVVPILLLLACPIMHIFMHKNHDTHDGEKK